jgi:hypothetical protein
MKPFAQTKASRPQPAIVSEGPRIDLRKYDELFGRADRIEASIGVIKSSIDTVVKTVKSLQETKADKEALQALFDQFRLAMGELSNRLGSLRRAIVQKADVQDLHVLRADVQKDLHAVGETAAGTEQVRCLLCGNPRHNVAGAIPPAEDAPPTRVGGPGVSTRVGGDATCFVYSETGEMFLGRSNDGKPIVMKNILGPSIMPHLRQADGSGDEV